MDTKMKGLAGKDIHHDILVNMDTKIVGLADKSDIHHNIPT